MTAAAAGGYWSRSFRPRFCAGDLLVTEGGHMLLALLAVICGIAMADLPVHCLHRDVSHPLPQHKYRQLMNSLFTRSSDSCVPTDQGRVDFSPFQEQHGQARDAVLRCRHQPLLLRS